MGSEYGDGADIGGALEVSGSTFIGDSGSDSLIIKAATYFSGSAATAEGKHVKVTSVADGTLLIEPGMDNLVAVSGSIHGSDTEFRVIGGEGSNAIIGLQADQGDDVADQWQLKAASSNDFTLESKTGGSFAAKLTVATDGDTTVAGDLTVSGGKVTLTNGSTVDSETVGLLKLTEDVVATSAALRVGNNIIQASDGGSTITMDASDNVTIGGNVTVGGNIIKASDGGSTITMDTSDNVTIGGDVTVGGNTIRASDGGATIELDTDDNVTIGGELTVTGGILDFGSGGHAEVAVGAVAGTDTAGKNLVLAAGPGTGTGEGGVFSVKVAPPAGSTGTSPNTAIEIFSINPNTTYVTNHVDLNVRGGGTHMITGSMEITGSSADYVWTWNSKYTDGVTMDVDSEGKVAIGAYVGEETDGILQITDTTGGNQKHLMLSGSGEYVYTTFTQKATGAGGTLEINNQDNKVVVTGSTASELTIDAYVGDPQLVFAQNGTDKWAVGMDDSDGDDFKINSAGSLVDESDFSISSAGNVLIGGNLEVWGDTTTFESANSTDPLVIIKNTTNDQEGAAIRFVKDKGAAGADGDVIGAIEFVGDDAAQTQTMFAKIVAEVSEADDTDEAGKLSLFVAESDGTTTSTTAGLVLEGEHATDGQVDATIGAGVASLTSVAGFLKVGANVIQASDGGSTITMDASDNVTIGGNVTVGGNIIKASDGGSTITMDTDDNVTIGGELTVTGGMLDFGIGQHAEIMVAEASGTNVVGKNLTLEPAAGTGNAAGGSFIINVAPAGASGASANTLATALTITSNKDAAFAGDVTVGGGKVTLTNGSTVDSESAGTLLLTEDVVKTSAALCLGSNVIQASNGLPTIAMDTSGNVVVAGVLGVGGGSVSGPADGSLTIKADTDLIFQIDADADGTETFQFKNGAGTEIVQINEAGDLQCDGDLTVSGNDIDFTAGNVNFGASIGANTLTVGAATTTTQFEGDVIVEDHLMVTGSTNLTGSHLTFHSKYGGDGWTGTAFHANEDGQVCVGTEDPTGYALFEIKDDSGAQNHMILTSSGPGASTRILQAPSSAGAPFLIKPDRGGMILSGSGDYGPTEFNIDTYGSATSGDAQIAFASNGTDKYAMGWDQSTGDFVLTVGGDLGASNKDVLRVADDGATAFFYGSAATGSLAICPHDAGGAGELILGEGDTGTHSVLFRYYGAAGNAVGSNTMHIIGDNNGSETVHATIERDQAGMAVYNEFEVLTSVSSVASGIILTAGAADPSIEFLTDDATKWRMGVDDDNSDNFFIGAGAADFAGAVSSTSDVGLGLAFYADGTSDHGFQIVHYCNKTGHSIFTHNDGNNNNRTGIGIACGTDAGDGGGIYGDGIPLAFYDGNFSPVGAVSFDEGSVTYSSFTGVHNAEPELPDGDTVDDYEYGMLVRVVGLKPKSGNQPLWKIGKTTTVKDPAVMGVYSSTMDFTDHPQLHAWTGKHKINSVGDGYILVCDEGGNIETGDYICSSNTAGHGMKQDDDLLHNYTVAKAMEHVDWSTESTTTKLVACTYHAG